jgi:hypothetical protein
MVVADLGACMMASVRLRRESTRKPGTANKDRHCRFSDSKINADDAISHRSSAFSISAFQFLMAARQRNPI